MSDLPENNYGAVEPDDLILRDVLAAGRTELANERTLLAYVRTALAVFAAGVTFVHFFDSIWLDVIGWGMVPVGVLMLVVGGVRYKRMNARIKWMQHHDAGAAR